MTTPPKLALSKTRQLFPVQRTWSPGETPSQDELDANLRDALNFLLSPPRCSVTVTNSQVISTGGRPVAYTWDTEELDTDEMWSSSAPTRITFNTPGLYSVKARLRYAYKAAAVGTMYQLGVAKNAGGLWPLVGQPNRLMEDTRPASNNSSRSSSLWCYGLFQFAADEYIEFFTEQNSGADYNPQAGDGLSGVDVRWVASS